jgi:LysM repeat protein
MTYKLRKTITGILLAAGITFSSHYSTAELNKQIIAEITEAIPDFDHCPRYSPYYKKASRAFERMKDYYNYFEEAEKKTGIPISILLALVTKESEGKLKAESPLREDPAKGPAQFREGTAREHGIPINEIEDYRLHPLAIVKAAEYLRYLLEREKNIYDALKVYSGNAPNYPENVLELAGIFEACSEDFQPPSEPLFKGLKKYRVKKGDNLQAIAKKLGVPLYLLKMLNPQLRNYNRIFPGLIIYYKDQICIPTKKYECYTVKEGDTLWKIAIENNTSIEAIKKANNLKKSKIFPGQKLKIPK